MKTPLFAHSRLDGLLVLVALAQFGLLLYGVLTFGATPWGVSLAAGLLSAFLVVTNYTCVGHNFVHNPFFTSRRLNRAFAVFNSLLVGAPETLHRIHHLHHHKYNNDAPDPATGTTQDYTSTWRYGKPPAEEGLLRYALLAHFRSDFGYLRREVARRGQAGQLAAESAALLAMLAAFAWLNPLGLAAFYLPVWLLGTVATHAENYLEHHGAMPGDRRTDSVSCYGRLYNLVWFNSGFHQEHHFRPQVHWADLPLLTALLPPAAERRVVRGAHWFNLGPPARRAEPVAQSPSPD